MQWGMIEQIQFEYGLLNETVTALIILNKNTKANSDTNFFDTVAGVLPGNTLAPYLFIIGQDYVLRTSIELIEDNGFTLLKQRSRHYPAKTNRCSLRRWSSASNQYTWPNQILTAKLMASRKKHYPQGNQEEKKMRMF